MKGGLASDWSPLIWNVQFLKCYYSCDHLAVRVVCVLLWPLRKQRDAREKQLSDAQPFCLAPALTTLPSFCCPSHLFFLLYGGSPHGVSEGRLSLGLLLLLFFLRLIFSGQFGFLPPWQEMRQTNRIDCLLSIAGGEKSTTTA